MWKAAWALDDAGYAVEDVEPPSVEAAKMALNMLNPDMRAGWGIISPLVRAYTKRFISGLFDVAGDPDPVTSMQSLMIRQSLLRAWG